jgi:hypothetical protein
VLLVSCPPFTRPAALRAAGPVRCSLYRQEECVSNTFLGARPNQSRNIHVLQDVGSIKKGPQDLPGIGLGRRKKTACRRSRRTRDVPHQRAFYSGIGQARDAGYRYVGVEATMELVDSDPTLRVLHWHSRRTDESPSAVGWKKSGCCPLRHRAPKCLRFLSLGLDAVLVFQQHQVISFNLDRLYL